MLHGDDANGWLQRLHATIAQEMAAHGLRFVFGAARGKLSEPTTVVFAGADGDLPDRKAAEASR